MLRSNQEARHLEAAAQELPLCWAPNRKASQTSIATAVLADSRCQKAIRVKPAKVKALIVQLRKLIAGYPAATHHVCSVVKIHTEREFEMTNQDNQQNQQNQGGQQQGGQKENPGQQTQKPGQGGQQGGGQQQPQK